MRAAASFAGTVTIAAPVTVGGLGDITLSGSVNSGTNVLTKIGNNTLTLSGSTDNNNLASHGQYRHGHPGQGQQRFAE